MYVGLHVQSYRSRGVHVDSLRIQLVGAWLVWIGKGKLTEKVSKARS